MSFLSGIVKFYKSLEVPQKGLLLSGSLPVASLVAVVSYLGYSLAIRVEAEPNYVTISGIPQSVEGRCGDTNDTLLTSVIKREGKEDILATAEWHRTSPDPRKQCLEAVAIIQSRLNKGPVELKGQYGEGKFIVNSVNLAKEY